MAERVRIRRVIPSLPWIGWREWVALPDLSIRAIKAKVDTGARSSALHVQDLEPFVRAGRKMVRFTVYPLQRSHERMVHAEAPLLEYRTITDSGGKATIRPVVLTSLEMMGQIWTIEVALTRRGAMGFRMLLGRQAVRHHFAIDAGRSYYGGKPLRKKRARKD